MSPFILFLMLLGASIFDSGSDASFSTTSQAHSDDDDAQAAANDDLIQDQVQSDDDEEVQGFEIAADGSSILYGGEGDDTYEAEYEYIDGAFDDSNIPTQVFMLGGDDTVVTEVGGYTEGIYGGDGNDAMVSTTVSVKLQGDDGNDTIRGVSGNELYGGAGNDAITSDLESIFGDYQSQVEGGPGDDQFTIIAPIINGNSDISAGNYFGDEGADTFAAELILKTVHQGPASAGADSANTGIRIMDFDPEEDVLMVEVNYDDGQEGREILSKELVPSSNGDYYEVRITMEDTSTEPEVTAVIRISGENLDGLSIDDISIATVS